eukprot:TRINITY_DN2179_c0_g3_i1.p2 TRINITY_DN2179_c0_g3~~TRINITY_DN2179_c0_g3_i1.p2  ORF type:complete len:163 (+),score=25.85 TRINITY_DN2179_c0_g3_i1:55-489(+)
MATKSRMPLLMGRAPLVHRSGINNAAKFGAFKRTRPIGGGGAYSDCPYPYVKLPYNPVTAMELPWELKSAIVACFFSICILFMPHVAYPRDDFFFWAKNEAFRRRRERKERQEMTYLNIDEDDVDPKLVQEIERLYVKGRKCTN